MSDLGVVAVDSHANATADLPPWCCPACSGSRSRVRFGVTGVATENGVDAEAFRPSASVFGTTLGRVVRCLSCGHGSLSMRPSAEAMATAYLDAADPVSVREECGQVETADRALGWIEAFSRPGRLLDVGCWTGSFLVAARARGWDVEGVEPSRWAAERAMARGVNVQQCALEDADLGDGTFDAAVLCDVLEHLLDPGEALRRLRPRLRTGAVLYVTVPDAGSLIARAMGRRWWSVLPMHLQYFTRASMQRLLNANGFHPIGVRSHAKVFTMRYYAERLGGYSPALGQAVQRAVTAAGLANRLVAPDFRDRLQVLALAAPV